VDAWEVMEIHHTGLDGTYMYVAPLNKVDEQWLALVLPNAVIKRHDPNYGWVISRISHQRAEFWTLLTALMDEGWQPFSWHNTANSSEKMTVALRRVKMGH
jgi:hypothetical protein